MAKHVPSRMCIACREMKPKKELIRLVARDGAVTLDEGGRAPGRGCYICGSPDCLEKAVREHRIEQQLKQGIDTGLREQLVAMADEKRRAAAGPVAGEPEAGPRDGPDGAARPAEPVEVKDAAGRSIRVVRRAKGGSR